MADDDVGDGSGWLVNSIQFIVVFLANLSAAELVANTIASAATADSSSSPPAASGVPPTKESGVKSGLKVVGSILVVGTVLHALLSEESAPGRPDEMRWSISREWVLSPVILAHLLLRTLSSAFNLKLYFGASDGVMTTLDRRDIGYGLALNYWHGFLKFILVKDLNVDAGPSVLDQMEKTGLKFSVKKLCVLVPTSCNFEKDDSKWQSLYNTTPIKEPAIEPITFTNIHLSQRASRFFPCVANFQDVSSEKQLTLCFNFPQILKSSSSAPKVADSDCQRRRNVQRFVEKLTSLIELHGVNNLVKVISYDDSNLESTRNLYELISAEMAAATAGDWSGGAATAATAAAAFGKEDV